MPRDGRCPNEQTLLSGWLLQPGLHRGRRHPRGAPHAGLVERAAAHRLVMSHVGTASSPTRSGSTSCRASSRSTWSRILRGTSPTGTSRRGRSLAREDGGFLVAGRPLTFAHLSGYSPALAAPAQQAPREQATRAAQPGARPRALCDDYGSRLTAAGFHGANDSFVTPFSTYDGVTDRPVVRRLVRTELRARVDRGGHRPGLADAPGRPARPTGCRPADEDARRCPTSVCYLSEVYRMRPDLQLDLPRGRRRATSPASCPGSRTSAWPRRASTRTCSHRAKAHWSRSRPR